MDEKIIDKIKQEERRSVKRTFIYTSVPIIVALIFIVFSYIKVKDLNQKVIELNKSIILKSDSLRILQAKYEFGLNYIDKRYHFGYEVDKFLFSKSQKQTRILEEVRELINYGNVEWKLGGNSVDDGFDSPSFASYLVNKYSNTVIPKDKVYDLYNYLQRVEKPEVGDLIVYEHGYTMIYFEYRNEQFCVGMTPVGLSSLELNFGPRIIGYLNIEY